MTQFFLTGSSYDTSLRNFSTVRRLQWFTDTLNISSRSCTAEYHWGNETALRKRTGLQRFRELPNFQDTNSLPYSGLLTTNRHMKSFACYQWGHQYVVITTIATYKFRKHCFKIVHRRDLLVWNWATTLLYMRWHCYGKTRIFSSGSTARSCTV